MVVCEGAAELLNVAQALARTDAKFYAAVINHHESFIEAPDCIRQTVLASELDTIDTESDIDLETHPYLQYLLNEISAYETKYNATKVKELEATTEQLKDYYSSSASTLWERKCDTERHYRKAAPYFPDIVNNNVVSSPSAAGMRKMAAGLAN